MAKRKQKRSIRKLTKTRDAARLRESRLQEIEKLLGEDFETLAEAERALKEATKNKRIDFIYWLLNILRLNAILANVTRLAGRMYLGKPALLMLS
jgi:uncharacterized membrane protein